EEKEGRVNPLAMPKWTRVLPGISPAMGHAGNLLDMYRSIFKGIGIGDPFARGSGAPQPSLTPEEKSNRDYYEQQLKSYQKKPTGPGAPAGFYSSEFGGGDFGGGVSKATDREGNFQRWLTEQQMSRNIEDRRNEATRDDTAQTKDNTRELKRLNDFLY